VPGVLKPHHPSKDGLDQMVRLKIQIMETFNDVISSDKLVLVDFFATWCQPCKMMHPILEQLKQALGDSIRIIKIDVDKQDITAGQYNIQSVPTLMLFRNGQSLWRQSGALSLAELRNIINGYL
jgi:thioredoxin